MQTQIIFDCGYHTILSVHPLLPPAVMVFIDSDYDRDSHMPVMMVVVDLFDQKKGFATVSNC